MDGGISSWSQPEIPIIIIIIINIIIIIVIIICIGINRGFKAENTKK